MKVVFIYLLSTLGLEITSFVVEHGYNSTALGFRFGSVAYISDVSKIPENVYELISVKEGLELLVLDVLSEKVVDLQKLMNK